MKATIKQKEIAKVIAVNLEWIFNCNDIQSHSIGCEIAEELSDIDVPFEERKVIYDKVLELIDIIRNLK